MIEPKKILLDTNIWIDFYMGDRPYHNQTRELITLALDCDLKLFYSLCSIKDVFYILACRFKQQTKKRSDDIITVSQALAAREAAWSCIKNMQEIAAAAGADGSDVWIATKYRSIHSDFEDNLVIASAMRAKADFLVTNDKDLLCHCPVPALSTSDMCKILRSESEESR